MSKNAATSDRSKLRKLISVLVSCSLVLSLTPIFSSINAYADEVSGDAEGAAANGNQQTCDLSLLSEFAINCVNSDGEESLSEDATVIADADEQTVQDLAAAATKDGTQQFAYLSDLSLITTDNWSYNGWAGHGIQHDRNQELGTLSLIVNGEKREYAKGVSVHAKGQATYDISALSTQYPRFTAKIGVDGSRGTAGLVKYTISASDDGENWDVLHASPNLTGSSEADDVDVDVSGRKYLRIYIDPLGANTADHGTVANAKLVTADYEAVDFNYEKVRKLDYYDAIISQHDVEYNYKNNYQLVLERALVNKFGYWPLQNLLEQSPELCTLIDWIFENQDIAEYVLEVGEVSNTATFLQTLYPLYTEYKSDFSREDGYVFKKMAIALAAARTTDRWFPGFLYASTLPTYDVVERYAIFKKLYDDDLFQYDFNDELYNKNYKEQFKNYHIELMRLIMNAGIHNDEILWMSDWVGNKVYTTESGLGFMRYNIKYLSSMLPQEKYFDEANREYYTNRYNLNAFNVPYGDKPTLRHWMMIDYGGICSNISNTAVIISAIRGIPGIVTYQPGHQAFAYYQQTDDGQGFWELDNSATDWGTSATAWYGGNRFRSLFGWEWKSFCKTSIHISYTGNNTAYTYLAQANLNNYPAFKQSYYYNLIANSYSDIDQKVSTYDKALEVDEINLDSWEALVNSYKADKANKTSGDWKELAERIIDAYTYYPMAMDDLIRVIRPYLNDADATYILSAEHDALKVASNATKNDLLQYDACVQVANTLLKASPNDMASFSLDGANKGKIVFNSPYNTIGFTWRYSLDGGVTRSEEFFDKNVVLTDEQILSLSSQNGIQIYVQGLSETKPTYTIQILDTALPDDLYANDLENRVVGVDTSYEWRNDASQEWTSYATASPNNTGNKSLEVRIAGKGNHLPSPSKVFTFTADNQPLDRKYVSVSHLKVESYSAHVPSMVIPYTGDIFLGSVENAIDGNANSSWFNYLSYPPDSNPYITLKLDKPRYVSAVEIVPGKASYVIPETDPEGNPLPDYMVGMEVTVDGRLTSATLEGSTDGITWKPLIDEAVTFDQTADIQTIEVPEKYRPEEGGEISYIRIKGSNPNNYFYASMINVYQDLRNARPTASIVYSPSKCTNQDVLARLDNISSDNYKITSAGGENHVFTENGEWEFTFVDLDNGKEGSEKAIVDWIDKTPPTAELTYNMDETTGRMKVEVVNPSEEITFEEGNGTYEYVSNGNYEIAFYDSAGNRGSLVARITCFGTLEAPGELGDNSYPLTLDANGGTWSANYTVPTEYDSTQTLILPGANEISRQGYTFAGWFLRSSNGSLIGSAITEIPAGTVGEMTLAAKWDVAVDPIPPEEGEDKPPINPPGTDTPGTDTPSGDASSGDSSSGGTPSTGGSGAAVTAPTMTVYAANALTGKLTLANGKSFSLKGTALVKKEGVNFRTTKKVTYKSSNTKIATVSASGKVKANKKKTGKVKITITSVDNPKNKKVITVNVVKKKKYKSATKIKKISLKASYKANAKKQIKVTVKKWTPSAPSNKNFVVSVSPKSRATVDPATNKIIFKKKGTVTVTVKSTSEAKAKLKFKVKVK